jgi:hypothetical protein
MIRDFEDVIAKTAQPELPKNRITPKRPSSRFKYLQGTNANQRGLADWVRPPFSVNS